MLNENFEECDLSKTKIKIINLKKQMELTQVRIPRSNATIHKSLLKLQNYYLQNDFNFEVFYQEKDKEEFHLLFSDIVNTEKSVQDLILPLENPEKIKKIVIRGDFDRKIHVVLYGNTCEEEIEENVENKKKEETEQNKEKKEELEGEKKEMEEEKKKVIEERESINKKNLKDNIKLVLRNNLHDLKNLDIKQLEQFSIGGITTFHFDPALINFSEEDLASKETSIYTELKKIEEIFDSVLKFQNEYESHKKETLFACNYLNKLTQLTNSLQFVIKLNKSYLFDDFHYKKTVLKDLPNKLHTIVCYAIKGNIDGISEKFICLKLLKQLLNSESETKLLLQREDFVKDFLVLGLNDKVFRFSIMKLFLDILYSLLNFKEFRKVFLSSEEKNLLEGELKFNLKIPTQEEVEKMLDKKLEDNTSLKKRKKRKKDKKEKKEKKDKKKKDKKKKKKKSKKEKKKKNSLDSFLKSESESDDYKENKIELTNIYHLIIKKMISDPQNPLFFKKLRDFKVTMALSIYIKDLKRLISKICLISEDEDKMLAENNMPVIELLENFYVTTKRIYKNIQYLFPMEKEEESTKNIYENLEEQIKIEKNKNIFEFIIHENKKKKRISQIFMLIYSRKKSYLKLIY